MAEISIGDDLFHVQIDGPEDAPALVLSNSLGSNLSMWDDQIPALSEKFRCIRYDSRGHGQSAVTEGPYSLERLGRDALAVMDALGVEKAHWLGLSMGGAVGQWMMLNAPERVDRVILANTASKFGSPDTWNQRMAVVREGGLEALIDGVVDRWLTKDFQAAAPEAVARVRAMVLATPADGYIASMGGLRDIDLREPVRAAKSPVLVIVGDQDQGTTPEQGAEIVAAIPGARLVTLKAAHLSNIEDAAAFNAAVLDFLTSPLAALKPAATVYPRRRPAKKATKKPLRPAPAATLAPAKKATKKAAVKKAAAKKAAKKAVKKAAKKAAKKAVKKAPKKGVKKATKKPVKKAASKATKKAVVKKASAKKATPRKAAVKTASKSAKKPVKKAVKTAKGTGARKAKPKKAR